MGLHHEHAAASQQQLMTPAFTCVTRKHAVCPTVAERLRNRLHSNTPVLNRQGVNTELRKTGCPGGTRPGKRFNYYHYYY